MQKRTIVIPIAAGILGIVLGSAAAGGTPDKVEKVQASPQVVTETETVTETVEVEVVPAACLDALVDADALMLVSSEMATLVSGHLTNDQDLFNQFATFDFTNIEWYLADQEDFTVAIGGLADQVNASTYQVNRDACRATSN